MSLGLHRVGMVALLIMGSAILLFSCKSKQNTAEESLDAIKTEESENLTIIMSENGRKSYLFTTPLLEGYTLGRDPYREFRKGISITTYKDDSLTSVNAVLVANYAIYYENRKLWEAKGDVVITKHDGTRLYTQQIFWNSITKRIYSNVDTRLVTDTDEVIGEGFESDEEMTEPRFRRWKGKMQVDTEQLRNNNNNNDTKKSSSDGAKSEPKVEQKESRTESRTAAKPRTPKRSKPQPSPRPQPEKRNQPHSEGVKLENRAIMGGREMQSAPMSGRAVQGKPMSGQKLESGGVEVNTPQKVAPSNSLKK